MGSQRSDWLLTVTARFQGFDWLLTVAACFQYFDWLLAITTCLCTFVPHKMFVLTDCGVAVPDEVVAEPKQVFALWTTVAGNTMRWGFLVPTTTELRTDACFLFDGFTELASFTACRFHDVTIQRAGLHLFPFETPFSAIHI